MQKLLSDPESEKLSSILMSLGDCVPLDFRFDMNQLHGELAQFESDWRPYNPRKPDIARMGLSLTSLDGGLSGIPDLDSVAGYNREHNTNFNELSFRKTTKVHQECRSLHGLFEAFQENLGRSHFIKLGSGGFFPPHRDLDLACFRVFVPCFRANKFNFSFLLDDKLLHLREGIAYYINTRKAHSIFSFVPNSIHLVLNIGVSEQSVRSVVRHLVEY